MSKKTKKNKPAEGSLRWYENEWLAAFLATPKSGKQLPHITMLAQLSYENAQLRRRVEVAERLLFTMTTGMVLGRDGNPHLLGCSIREGERERCDCGSVPLHDRDKERE